MGLFLRDGIGDSADELGVMLKYDRVRPLTSEAVFLSLILRIYIRVHPLCIACKVLFLSPRSESERRHDAALGAVESASGLVVTIQDQIANL